MNLPLPSTDKFKYDRQHIPIFFDVPTEEELHIWEKSYGQLIREYLKLCRDFDESVNDLPHEKIPLSNGITLEEFAMWVHVERKRRRKREEKKSLLKKNIQK